MVINDFLESTKMTYPNYLIKDMSNLKQHQARVLQQIMKPMKGVRPDYKVYVQADGEIFEIGGIFRGSVRLLVDLVGEDNLEMRLSKDKVYTGNMLYVLG